MTYYDVIRTLRENLDPSSFIISGAGLISRELCTYWDRPNNLYIQGAMGLSASVALGIGLSKPDVQVVILDGDGSTLMHLGTLTTIGKCRPRNIIHIVLDNECHLSTGGQSTATATSSLFGIAMMSGYDYVALTNDEKQLLKYLKIAQTMQGTSFICVKTDKCIVKKPPRPRLEMTEIANRFREALNVQLL